MSWIHFGVSAIKIFEIRSGGLHIPSERNVLLSPVSVFVDPDLRQVTSKGIQPYTQSS